MIGDNALPTLAASIRAAHANVKASALQAAEQALEVGRLLNEARALIPHGAWAEWLKQHVGFSERSARRYMQIARAGFNSATVADLGIRAAAESIARPKLKYHPYIDIFPAIAGKQRDGLFASVANFGLIQPITLYRGMILDGRGRYEACLASGREMKFVEFAGDDEGALAYVMSTNFYRSNYDEDQKAVAFAKFQILKEREIAECRLVRDAEKASPGIVRDTLDGMLARGEEPMREALHERLREVLR